jgi:IclR family transcriptional regulator, acetate operon repressor
VTVAMFAPQTVSASSAALGPELPPSTLPIQPGRGVLEGAFAVLDALSRADEGLGLTALARASGLAKTSAHRITAQLVSLGAVECCDRRYFVGPLMLRVGQRWQPDPLLRRCAQGPVHALATRSRAMASLRIMDGRRLRYICATVPRGYAVADHLDPESIARTATGRVLFAAQPAGSVALPDCWSQPEWRKIQASLRDSRAAVIDHQDAIPGICCASAPVWWPDGTCAGALTVSVHADKLPVNLPILLSHIASRIGATLREHGQN